jgi:hypothetical protein
MTDSLYLPRLILNHKTVVYMRNFNKTFNLHYNNIKTKITLFYLKDEGNIPGVGNQPNYD